MLLKKRILIITLLTTLLAIGWWHSYSKINSYYAGFSNTKIAYYSVGETVDFGEDYLNVDLNANGYTIRVDRFEIVDYSEFVQNQGLTEIIKRDTHTPEKLALVYITLCNVDSNAEGIMLTELKLHGIDQNVPLDWSVLDVINPVLSGNLGVALSQGSRYQLILPYSLRQRDFLSAWENIDKYSLFLQLTSFPTVKEIQVQ